MEDSLDCCRQCMMIRQTKTNQMNMSSNMTDGIIHQIYVLIDYVYDLCLYTLYCVGGDRGCTPWFRGR